MTRTIIPGIQEQTYPDTEKKFLLVKPYVDWVQIDVTDGTLTSNQSLRNPEAFEKLTSQKNLEVHLMTKNASETAVKWINTGFKRVIAHVESDNPKKFINEIKGKAEVCLALDGPSPIDLLYPFLEQVDGVLIMMYKAGPSGQTFQPAQLEKVKLIHQKCPALPIEVDGGINEETIKLCEDLGATRFVATSAIYKSDNIEEAIKKLRGIV